MSHLSPLLIASCTKTKRGRGAQPLALGRLTLSSPRTLAEHWLALASGELAVPTLDLYGGPAWQCVVRAARHAEVGVLSAGFGLVLPGEAVPYYEASFTSGENQVAQRIEGKDPILKKHQHWWQAVNLRRHGCSNPLTSLIAHSERLVIVAAGSEYMAVVQSDLEGLAATLGNSRLLIICPSKHIFSEKIEACRLPAGSAATEHFAVTHSALAHRLAEWAIATLWNEEGSNMELIRKRATDLAGSKVQKHGQRSDDDHVRLWLRGRDLTISPTRLLSEYRAGGDACEQRRFRSLVLQVRQELGA